MVELVRLINRSPRSFTASSSEALRLHVTPGRSEAGFLCVNGEGLSLRSGSNQPILHVWRDNALGPSCLRFRVAQWEPTFSTAPFDIYQNCLVIVVLETSIQLWIHRLGYGSWMPAQIRNWQDLAQGGILQPNHVWLFDDGHLAIEEIESQSESSEISSSSAVAVREGASQCLDSHTPTILSAFKAIWRWTRQHHLSFNDCR